MTQTLSELFNLYRFPNGRRAYALRGVAQAARQLGLSEVAGAAEQTAAWESETTAMIRQWQADRDKTEGARRDSQLLDQKLDRAWGGVAAQLTNLQDAFAGLPVAALADRIARKYLPEGAGVITRLPYEEELARSKDLLAALRALPDSERNQLGLDPFLARVGEILPEFEQSLDSAEKRELDYDQIKARDAEGQERLLSVLVRALAAFPELSAEHATARTTLLAPVLDQQRRLKDAYSRRSGITDLDDAGEEIAPRI